MKKYKHLFQAVVSYIISVIWFFVVPKPIFHDYPYLILVTSLLGLYGVFLGFKSVKEKELPIIGYLLVLVGAVIVVASIGILRLELSPI